MRIRKAQSILADAVDVGSEAMAQVARLQIIRDHQQYIGSVRCSAWTLLTCLWRWSAKLDFSV